MTDVNGNTALHYSVSHGNFDVVSVLLDSKVSNLSILNKAGYTCVMLISLAPIATETHRSVVARDARFMNCVVIVTFGGLSSMEESVANSKLNCLSLVTTFI